MAAPVLATGRQSFMKQYGHHGNEDQMIQEPQWLSNNRYE